MPIEFLYCKEDVPPNSPSGLKQVERLARTLNIMGVHNDVQEWFSGSGCSEW